MNWIVSAFQIIHAYLPTLHMIISQNVTSTPQVEAECSGLQQQVEVREVSSRAAALGARLGDAAALAEPRENAFLAVDFAHNDAPQRFVEALCELGRVRTSTTFPGLCTLQLGN